MISHYHITLRDVTTDQLESAASLINGKPTTIDLSLGKREQRDRMVTKYQKGISAMQMLEDDITLRNAGFFPIRLKLEEILDDLLVRRPLSRERYKEVHVKVEDNNLEHVDGFVFSSNAVDGHRFYNGRAYCEEDLDKLIEGLYRITQKHKVISKHFEYIWFDSNLELDRWWA